MVANVMVVLLGALSMAGIGFGAVTVSNMPHGGFHMGGFGANGNAQNGQSAGPGGGCGMSYGAGVGTGNGTCFNNANGTCPYANQTGASR